MKHFTLRLLAACLLACWTLVGSAQTPEPILTIGCLSDMHSELSLINPSSGNVSDVQLRGTITNTLSRMLSEEDLDLIVLGGDCTSDVTISEDKWQRVRELMKDAFRSAFRSDKTKRPVIYVTGNHDYEVANFDNLPKPYNAADYLPIMEEDIAALDPSEAFYEYADNGSLGTMRLLAAFHYVIDGFDFVMLNCGKYFFQSAWNYTYSQESVEWVDQKLDEIYSDNPNKTVFFVLHIPFGDSNSISAYGKGLACNSATQSGYALKQALAKHPNLIMLYGHDHGTDSAYIRTNTSQRITRYDTSGNVISSFDEDHYDDESSDEMTATGTASVALRSYEVEKYLTYSTTTNLTTSTTPTYINVAPSASFTGSYSLDVNGSYVYCGSGATYSGNPDILQWSSCYLYKVEDPDASPIKATRITDASELTSDTNIIILTAAKKDAHYYLLTNHTGTNRMESQYFSDDLPGRYITDDGIGADVIWTVVESGGGGGGSPETTNLTSGTYLVQSVATGENLVYDSSNNIETSTDKSACTISSSGDYFTINITGTRNLHIGSGGRFSGGTASNIMLFRVDNVSGSTYSGTRSMSFDLDAKYMLVAYYSGGYYALSNQLYNADMGDDQRMRSTAVTVGGTTATVTADPNLLWSFRSTVDPDELVGGEYVLHNEGNNEYLALDENNLCTATSPMTCSFSYSSGFTIALTERHLHIGSGGRFSRGDAQTFELYRVEDLDASTMTATQVSSFKVGEHYLIVGIYGGNRYALSNQLYNAGMGDDQRLMSQAVTATAGTITFTANKDIIWTIEEPPTVTPDEPSFLSAFMGSMRYYNNSIEGDVSVSNSKIVQALMIYVYDDHIDMKMKNYGESGTFSGITVNEDLVTYHIKRNVEHSDIITGIDTNILRPTTDGKTVIYDLQGRRVKEARQGVYIINNQKVLVK